MKDPILDTSLCRDKDGPLSPDLQVLIVVAAASAPDPETWNEAWSLTISTNPYMTLFRAIITIYPSFPAPDNSSGFMKWRQLPTTDMIINAVHYATH